MTFNIYTDGKGHIRTKKYREDFYEEHPITKETMKKKGFFLAGKIIILNDLEKDLKRWKRLKMEREGWE